MKAIFEIASGKRYRNNRFTSMLTEEALKRFSSMNLTKQQKALPLAIVTVAPEVMLKLNEIGWGGRKPTDAALLDLNTYIAWLLPERACAAGSSFAEENKTTLQQMHRDIEAVYPLNQAVSKAAKRFDEARSAFNNASDIDRETFATQFASENWNIMNALAGIPSTEALFKAMYEVMKYGLALNRAIEYGHTYFTQYYPYLLTHPEAIA